MIKVTRKDLEAGKVQRLKRTNDRAAEIPAYGRATRHGDRSEFFAVTVDEFKRRVGACNFGRVDFPRQFAAHVDFVKKHFSYGHELDFSLGCVHGWAISYTDPAGYSMQDGEGPENALEFRFRLKEISEVEILHKVVFGFKAAEIFVTNSGRIAFKVAEIDDGAALFSALQLKNLEWSGDESDDEAA